MRKVRVLINNLADIAEFVLALNRLDHFGEVLAVSFNKGVPFVEVVLCTARDLRHLQQQLASLLPHIYMGVEEQPEENSHDCQTAA